MSTQPRPTGEPDPTMPEGSRPSLGAVATIVGVAVLLVFMLQNRQDIRVHLFFWHVTLPVWFIIFGSALLGALVWIAAGVFRRRRRRKADRQARKA
ncbi:MAG: LapA family protein [Actinobacteria bacterium]|nr:MAG: LapA family protein [Actinomycetota bacterium]